MTAAFDVIGDIHGYADELERLLDRMGYRLENGVYRHGERCVLFLGDFIDGGTRNRRVLEVVRPMVDAGEALAIMGNHEYNAICYHTPDPRRAGAWLRAHTDQHFGQHRKTLAEFDGDDAGLREMIDWFRTLPLYLELEGLRAVHACWDTASLEVLADRLVPSGVMDDAFLVDSTKEYSPEHAAVETVLKGAEAPLPEDIVFKDNYGHPRSEARIRWWLDDAESLDAMVIGPPALYESTRGHAATPERLIGYDKDAPPVFFGHYWLQGEPRLQQGNVVCLDYSVARKGKLVAYRWDGEQTLDPGKFVY